MRVFVTGATGFIGSAVSAHVGEGRNRWNAVHRLDAACLFRFAVEKKVPPGTRYHGLGEESIEFRKIAEVIGKNLNLAQHFGWFTHFAAIDCPSSSKQTQEKLGWRPNQPGLIADLHHSRYFKK